MASEYDNFPPLAIVWFLKQRIAWLARENAALRAELARHDATLTQDAQSAPGARAARIDATAASLVKAAKQMGADYMPLNGVIDGLLFYRGKVTLVDWKSPGGTLTPDQSKWTARGWPIAYISTVEQLAQLLGASKASA